MGFFDSISSFFRNYAVFSGRSSRSEYCCAKLFIYVVFFIMSALGFMQAFYKAHADGNLGKHLSTSLSFSFLFSIFVIMPCISLFVRRLHDLNLSGWWFWLWPAIMVFAFSLGAWDALFVPWAWGGLFLLAVISEVLVMCIRGTIGPNRFGDDPVVCAKRVENGIE